MYLNPCYDLERRLLNIKLKCTPWSNTDIVSNLCLISSLLNFASTKTDGEKLLKVTSADVPDGILPEGYVGVLRDIKVSGHQADDSIYSNHPDIRQKVS